MEIAEKSGIKFKLLYENVQISNRKKLFYLWNILKETSLKFIHGLTLTPNNYNVVIGLLKYRLGENKIIVKPHVNKLLILIPVKTGAK